MGGSAYVALLCLAALQAVVVLAAARYGARKALARVEAIAESITERVGRIEEHLGYQLGDEPAVQYAIDPSVEAADRSGLFAPRQSEGMDCG